MIKHVLRMGVCILALAGWGMPGRADDLSDGISEYTDENISADESIGTNKDTNINFIVVDALAKAGTGKKDKAGNETGKSTEKKDISQINGGTQDNNENSVVVEAGSRVDKVYNIVIEK